MRERIGQLDSFELDDMIDAGTPTIELVGRRVLWHGQYTGTVVELRSGRLAVRLRLPCATCRTRRRTVYVTSGCHRGAFCYVSDPKTGAHLADLRNQVVCCTTCAESETTERESIAPSTPRVEIPDRMWTETGPDEDPAARLLARIAILGTDMHLEAVAVRIVDHMQRALDSDDSFGNLAAFAEPDGPFQTTSIRGRDYVLAAYPYC